MRKAAFIYSPDFEKYHYPPDCPFNISRAGKTRKILNSMGLLTGKNKFEAVPESADRLTLKKFHSAHYIHALKNAAKGKLGIEAFNMGIGTPDCPVFKDMYDYSALAAGATLKGASLILSGEADIAFNPSGGFHHAQRETAAGFCYINDVVLACIAFAEAGKKVLYLDVDVHHGDGVADAFYDRSDVMTISLHQNPKTLFPGTGFEDEIGLKNGKGYCVNIPLPIGTYDEAYTKAFNEIVVPLMTAFEPDVIVFELGADGLAGDPLAHLQLTNNVYAKIAERLLETEKPILATGGGGYHIENTVRAWALCWSVFCGEDNSYDMNIGMGGVMLESTDWQAGLRDRVLTVTNQQEIAVTAAIENTIETLKKNVFKIHGL